jgi:hypothetical protein
MDAGSKHRPSPWSVKPFDHQAFDCRGASYCIEITIEAVLRLIEEHPPPRDLIVLHLLQMDVGALHRLPIGIMIIRAVAKLSIVDPFGDWHCSHEGLALIHPEHPDVSAHDTLPYSLADGPPNPE